MLLGTFLNINSLQKSKYDSLELLLFHPWIQLFSIYSPKQLLNAIIDSEETSCLAGVYGDRGGAWVDEE